MSSRPLSLQEFKSIYSKVIRLTVDFVIRDKGKVLLTKRNIEPKKGFWHLPGGTVLKNESLEEAVQRLATDELGTRVTVECLLTLMEYYKYGSSHGHSVSLVYLVKPSGIIQINQEASEYGFFNTPPEPVIKEVAEYWEVLSGVKPA